MLAHTQAATTARYARLLDEPLRAATARGGRIVGEATGQALKTVAKIAPFSSRS